MSEELAAALLASATRLLVPLLLAALGELIAERAGVVNIGVEGMMLAGALTAAAVGHHSGSPWLGLGAALIVGGLLALGFAAVALHAGGDAIVTGTAVNLLALGATGFVHRAWFAGGFEVPMLGSLPIPGLHRLPVVGHAWFDQPLTTYAAVAAVVAVRAMLASTGLGLRLRAAGEEPLALATAGFDVVWVRTIAVVIGGALAGVAGGALVVAHAGTFVEGMTAGRGFIALGLVICAGWRVGVLLLVALLFGSALALQYEVQAMGIRVPYQLVRMLPYVATLATLAFASRRVALRAPASLGTAWRSTR